MSLITLQENSYGKENALLLYSEQRNWGKNKRR